MVGPLPEVGRTVSVAQRGVSGIGHKPGISLIEELFEITGTQYPLSLLLKEQAQVIHLGSHDLLIVYLRQCVEPLSYSLIVFALRGILEGWQLREVHILRMESEDGYATIRIGVVPVVMKRGVVDGQNLQHALSGTGHEVNHLLQVAKVAHPKAGGRTQGEYGYERSSQPRVADGKEGHGNRVHTDLTKLGR